MKNIKSIGVLQKDPALDYKKKVFEFLEIKPEIIGTESDCKVDIIDLSSFLEVKDVGKYLEHFTKVIVSPLMASKLESNSKVYTAYPLRQWGVAKKIVEISGRNACGDMTSIRIQWTIPKKLSSDEEKFLYFTVAGLIDLGDYMTKDQLKTMYLEKVRNENNLFGLLTYKNGIVVELEINETLPNSMGSGRFINATFTEGLLSNMPLAGFENEQGSIFADDKTLTRMMIEDIRRVDFDEIENTYWQMLMAIDNGSYPMGTLNSKTIIDAIDKAVKAEKPVNMESRK